MRFETKVVHTGVHKDQQYNSVITPIYPSSTFYWNDLETNSGYDYTRSGNPTRDALNENLAALEGGVGCVTTSTGMSAVHCAMAIFNPGDHIVVPADVYGGTFRLFSQFLTEKGLSFTFVDMTDIDAVKAAVQPATKGFWIETPSNPMMKVIDLAAIVEIAKQNKAVTICDNTFLSPYLQRPLEFGVDVVMHSTTKYINGHSDVVGGAVISKDKELGDRMAWICNALGLACSPYDAWLVLRGVKTLGCRMDAQQANAMKIARFLDGHPLVETVYYPGLESHPQHELAKSQQQGFGAMLSFDVKDGRPVAERVCMNSKLFDVAESLGGVESLISFPVTMSHASMSPEGRQAAGITEKTVRVSVGLEHADDLIEDLKQALDS
ncbi:trans-sulfuration enzyme family protein [Fuerstiella marisgermanici]|uniref:Cystathionine beta-lyase n=1 Tax=Fuerstiella marisgermanici TaxID=1891926 RepID=A0A1P8WLA5_9PLAN|nr:PLP-dependent aspartate aminotransferase family protein [Fuerstiella marisgermanici]APZ94839.1 Cystathionine beta-lyase [Fuerstiella marisgermanici]